MSTAPSLDIADAKRTTVRRLPWDGVDPVRWNRFVVDCPDAFYFHTPEWMSLLARSFPNWRGKVLLAEDRSGEWCALLPYVCANRFGVRTVLSMPFGAFGGPLVREGCPPEALPLMCGLLLSENRAVNTRGLLVTEYGNRALQTLPAEVKRCFRIVHGTTQVLDLTGGAEMVWRNRFQPQRRRQASSARQRGLVVRRGEGLPDYLAYHQLYDRAAREGRYRIRPPRLFFENLARAESPHVQLWVAEHDGILVAGNLSFHYRDDAVSLSGAMRCDYAWCHPAVALHDATIREACACGCHTYHFGPSPRLPGVARFKEQFGCEEKRYSLWAAISRLGHLLEWMRPAIQRACDMDGRR